MISDRFLKLFKAHLKWATYFFATPIVWDERGKTLAVTRTSFLTYSILYTGEVAVYVLFLLIQLVLEFRKGHRNDISFFFLYAITVCGIFDLATALTLACKSELVITVILESFKFFKGAQRYYMPQFHPNQARINKLFDGIFTTMTFTSPMMGIVIGLHAFFFPEWPMYISSLFLRDDGTPKVSDKMWLLVRLWNGSCYMYGIQAVWANLLIFTDINCVCFWYAWLILREFLCGRSRYPYLAVSNFRSFQELPTLYNRFQILCGLYVDFSSCFIVPLLAILINIILFCNYTLISQWGNLDGTSCAILMLWSAMSTNTAMVTLSLLGRWYIYSKRVIRSIKYKDWGYRGRNLGMKRFAKSCRPLSFGLGKFYVIRRVSVLKFLKRITRGTLRALLTLNRH